MSTTDVLILLVVTTVNVVFTGASRVFYLLAKECQAQAHAAESAIWSHLKGDE